MSNVNNFNVLNYNLTQCAVDDQTDVEQLVLTLQIEVPNPETSIALLNRINKFIIKCSMENDEDKILNLPVQEPWSWNSEHHYYNPNISDEFNWLYRYDASSKYKVAFFLNYECYMYNDLQEAYNTGWRLAK